MRKYSCALFTLSMMLSTGTALSAETTAHWGMGPLDPDHSSYTVKEGDTLNGLTGQETYQIHPQEGQTQPLPDLPNAQILVGSAPNGAVSMGSASSLTVNGTIREDANGYADRGMVSEEKSGDVGSTKNTYADTVNGYSLNTITVGKTGQIITTGGSGSEAINLSGIGNVIDNSGLIHADNRTSSQFYAKDPWVNNGATAIWMQNNYGINTIINRASGVISTDAKGEGTYEGNVIGGQNGGGIDLENQGKIIGKILMADGNDTIDVYTGSDMDHKDLDGHGGVNTFGLNGDGTGNADAYHLTNFQKIVKDGSSVWDITQIISRDTKGDPIAVDTTVNGGTLRLLGDDTTYQGTMTINKGGNLSLGNGGTTGTLSGQILNNGQVTFNHSNDWSYGDHDNQSMVGNGVIDKEGAGTLTFNGGMDQFMGSAMVNAGAMNVASNMANTSVDVKNTATLEGSGTVGSTHIEAGGALSPAGSGTIGNINIVGTLTMDQQSKLIADGLANQVSDLVDVTGNAQLNGGTVQFNVPTNTILHVGQVYTLVSTTTGVTGRYDNLATNLGTEFAYLSPSLSYTQDLVQIRLTRNGTSYTEAADTGNQIAAAGALDTVQPSAMTNAIDVMNKDNARKAFDQVSGELHASVRTVMMDNAMQIGNTAVERLRGAWCDPDIDTGLKTAKFGDKQAHRGGSCYTDKPVLWGTAYGAWSSIGGDGNAAGIHSRSAGFIIGADTEVWDHWRIGGLVGYGNSSFSLSNGRNSSGHSNDVSVGIYGGKEWGHLALRMGATYTWDMLSTTRNVRMVGFTDRLRGSYLGGTATGWGDIGYKFHTGNTVIEPFMNVTYVNTQTDKFTEKGGSSALHSHGVDTGATFGTFGLRMNHRIDMGGWTLSPHEMFGYRHGFGLHSPQLVENFAAGSDDFQVTGARWASDAAVANVGLTAQVSDRLDVGLSYVGQYGRSYYSNGVRGNLAYRF